MGSVLVVKTLNNHQADRMRLNGIDGPEKGRISANEPRTPPQSWFYGKEVTVQTWGEDKYGRTIADMLRPDGTNVNHTLVQTAGAGGIGSMRRGIRCWKG